MLARKKRGRREAAVRDTLKTVRSTVDTVVRRLVGSTDPEYEDLVQSSLVNVLATFDRGKFRGDCPPRGWAAVIARNVAVDATRARGRRSRTRTADRSAGDAGPGQPRPERPGTEEGARRLPSRRPGLPAGR